MRAALLCCILLLTAVAASPKRRYSVVEEDDPRQESPAAEVSDEPTPPPPTPTIPTKPPNRGMFGFAVDALSYNNDAALVELAKQHQVPDMSWFRFVMVFFPFEACGIATFVVAIIAFFANSKVNKLFVTSFLRNHIAIFGTQFHRIDFGREGETSQGATIMKDGPCYFRCFGSGRKNIKQCLTTFDLQHRQNLFRWAAQSLRIVNDQDVVTMEAFLTSMPPIGVIVARDIKSMSALLQGQPTFGELPTTRFTGWKNAEGATKLSCMTDSTDAASRLLVGAVENVLNTAGSNFVSLTIFDHSVSLDEMESNRGMGKEKELEEKVKGATEALPLPGEAMISLRFRLGGVRNQLKDITPLVHLFFSLIDRVAEMDISSITKRKGLGMRQGLRDKKWAEIKATRAKDGEASSSVGSKSNPKQKKKDDLLS